MSRIWKLAVLTALLGVAGAIGAGVYSAVDGEANREPKATYEPMLADEEIIQLARTHLRINDLINACLGSSDQGGIRLDRYNSFVPRYQDNGSWVVTGDWCTFVVDDATGEVTGP